VLLISDHQVCDEPVRAQEVDELRREVDAPTVQFTRPVVPRERMVKVVPAFPEREAAQELVFEAVEGFVVRFVAVEMGDGVDAPGAVEGHRQAQAGAAGECDEQVFVPKVVR